jgi:DNA-binding transcriptional ArsR family regulator
MDGRAQTASELARVAGVTPQTASWHLSRLVQRALLKVERRGPRRLYRLATPLVAQMLEGMMTVAVLGLQPSRPSPRIDDQMRRARTCYDHLAGELGVAVTDALQARAISSGPRCRGTDRRGYGISGTVSASTCVRRCGAGGRCAGPVSTGASASAPCRPGGAAVAELAFRQDWIRRRPQGRSVEITEAGRAAFKDLFGGAHLISEPNLATR